ncbi:TBC1 domain family member 16-like isoform X2 [Varroa destructor]|uniref:Rab-GAP TBC domain-containing protein n=1 Tax=Varroa destructor TaxID=109461 RepID=A0A7M7JX84_VARDE|nr:TBC1 domain family member 16-like isoform X2 [Varroa destructor]
MALHQLVRRASDILRLPGRLRDGSNFDGDGLSDGCQNSKRPRRRQSAPSYTARSPDHLRKIAYALDGDVIYCKNNVCVHPPAQHQDPTVVGATMANSQHQHSSDSSNAMQIAVTHRPGYLTIKAQNDPILGCSLLLTWIPNISLQRNPRHLENRGSTHSLYGNVSYQATTGGTIHNSGEPPLARGITSISSNLEVNAIATSMSPNNSQCSDRENVQCSSSLTSERRRPSDDFELNRRIVQGWRNRSDGDSDDTDSSVSSDDLATTSCEHAAPVGAGNYHSAMCMTEDAEDRVFSNATTCSDIAHDFAQCTPEAVAASAVPTASGDSADTEGATTATSATANEQINPTEVTASDSGIGPEEVTAALESMILGLKALEDDVWPTYPADTSAEPDAGDIRKGAITPGIYMIDSSEKQTITHADRPNNQTTETEAIPSRADAVSNMQAAPLPDTGTLKSNMKLLSRSPSTSSLSASTISNKGNATSTSLRSTPVESSESSPQTIRNKYIIEDNTPEDLVSRHNLAFPEPPASATSSRCVTPSCHSGSGSPTNSVFSIDLSQMKSLKLLFSNVDSTCGQLVIASRESQYKIFHFHHGGLDKLAEVFKDFDFLMKSRTQRIKEYIASGNVGLGSGNSSEQSNDSPSLGRAATSGAVLSQMFVLSKPRLSPEECHPEEDSTPLCDFDFWFCHENEDGVFENECEIRKAVFFRGVEPGVRRHVWPFLLFVYSFESTQKERDRIRTDNYIHYQDIKRRRQLMTQEQRDKFYRDYECTVEKDVVRTDRSNPFYAGEDNVNVSKMKEILLNYAVHNPQIGYAQGMSDLLAPILFEIRDEAETFWCFAGLMQRTSFVSCPTDTDMDNNLNYLRELLKLFCPSFYRHLSQHLDALELLFVHRWVLLCFKREFLPAQSLLIWEACWSQWLTAHFHLFVCVAIISVYGQDAVTQNMSLDEMLLHFSSLAMHMDARTVLRKARGLVYQFRSRRRLPCSLVALLTTSSTFDATWDSHALPSVLCVCADFGDTGICTNRAHLDTLHNF